MDGRVLHKRGFNVKLVSKTRSSDISVSRDGKHVLFVRDGPGASRTIVLWDSDTPWQNRDLLDGFVRAPKWSPDGQSVAFLRLDESSKQWQVWSMRGTDARTAARVSDRGVSSLCGWSPDGKSLLVFDEKNLYWIGPDGAILRNSSIADVWGAEYQWMSSDVVRIHPSNPDLLLITAYYKETPRGAAVDQMNLNQTMFTFDLKTGKRTTLVPPQVFARHGEWSANGNAVYFTRQEDASAQHTWRVFSDGSSLTRFIPEVDLSAAQ